MMFEQAARLKLRFNHKGLCSTEDLWDLSLTELDSIYKKLSAEAKTQGEDSLLESKNVADEVLELKISIVKRIVEVRLAEAAARKDAKEQAERKQKILSIIADKQDEALKNMSVEDLKKLAEA
jgi:hypothetical protein